MITKLLKVFLFFVLFVSLNMINPAETTATTKVMWGMTELKLGQIGKVTILSNMDLVKMEADGSLSTVRTMKKGEEYRVYSYKDQHNGLYGVGGGNFVPKNESVLYETPSKNKLAQLMNAQQPISKPVSSISQGVMMV